MELTTTQEIIYQAMALLVSGILTILGAYAKMYITSKIDMEKYGFENAKVEAIIDNGINYAEAVANKQLKEQSKDLSVKLKGYEKLNIARQYINDRVDKKTITKYATNLDEAIERKIVNKIKV